MISLYTNDATPISTPLMVGELTGNYALLLPSMLVVCLSMIIVHRWTIYSEQVRTRADSPAHRGELLHDVLAELLVGSIVDGQAHVRTVEPSTTIREVMKVANDTLQRTIPVVDRNGLLRGTLSVDVVRAVLAEDPARGLLVAADLMTPDLPALRSDEPVERALELLALQHGDDLPVVSEQGGVFGLLDRRAIIGAYRRRIDELREPAQQPIRARL